MDNEIDIRECTTLDELAQCVDLQREVFALPEIEISPVRHLVVTKNAGGFTLGAFVNDRLAGFVLSVPAFLRGQPAFYSHMTAVSNEHQGLGIGARLKWAQRDKSLELGVRFVKWTFEPGKARNAFFNLEKLGAEVTEFERDFYGTDYATAAGSGDQIGLASDRLFAQWHLDSDKVKALATGTTIEEGRKLVRTIKIPKDWSSLVADDPQAALAEQMRMRAEFEPAFATGLVAAGFRRDDDRPCYLMYKAKA